MSEFTIIGTQEWMIKNLCVTRFRNGDPIPLASTDGEWLRACIDKKPAYCAYQERSEISSKHGYLYNFYAVIDQRGITPEGWKIPNSDECKILFNSLGGIYSAGQKLKYTDGWFHEGNGDNASMWNARPGGSRDVSGKFDYFGKFVYFWANTELNNSCAEYFFLNWSNKQVQFGSGNKGGGHYLRCFRNV